MTRRKKVILALIAVIGIAAWWLWPSPPISRATYDRIRLGMTEQEVREVVGMAPGRCGPSFDPDLWDQASIGSTNEGRKIQSILHDEIEPGVYAILDPNTKEQLGRNLIWFSKDARITVQFDQSGQAVLRVFDERLVDGLLDRIQYWFWEILS